MKKKIIIIGTGGHATSVANVAHACGYDLLAFASPSKTKSPFKDIPVILEAEINEYSQKEHSTIALALGIGDNYLRAKILSKLQRLIKSKAQVLFPSLVHPSAVISLGATVGDGSVIMPNATIGPKCNLAQGCIVNTNASLDHDGIMAAFSSLGPGTHAGGNVEIGTYSAIGIGSAIKHNISIGNHTVIGANSYVHHHISDHLLAYGCPAKVIRTRKEGEGYL